MSCAMRSSSSRRFFSRSTRSRFFDAGGHRVERLRQLAKLIARANGDLVREVAQADPLGAREELVHRSGNRPRQRQAGDQRDRFDDQEEHTDGQQHQQQALPDGALRGRHATVHLADAQLHRGDDGAAARFAGGPVHHLRETGGHAGQRRHRIFSRRNRDRPASTKDGRACINRTDGSELDTGLGAQFVAHRIVHEQVDDDGVSRRRTVRHRDGPRDEVDVATGRLAVHGECADRTRGNRLIEIRVRKQPLEPAAADPGRQLVWRFHVRPRTGHDRLARLRRFGRWLRVGALARAVHGHDRDGCTRKSLCHGGLAPAGDGRYATTAGTLDFHSRSRGDGLRLLCQRLEPCLEQVRAEVREQQQPAQQEEGDDQDGRDEADEDVRNDEFSPDPPQQTPLCQRQASRKKVGAAGNEGHRRDRVEQAHECWRLTHQREHEDDQLDRGADRQSRVRAACGAARAS